MTADGAYLRLGPANTYGVVRVLDKNEAVDICGQSGNWYKVTVGGKEGGYVYKDCLGISAQKKTAPSAPAKQSAAPAAQAPKVSKTYSVETDFGQKVVEEARKYLGTKYVYGAESPSEGFDCSGFVWYVFRQCGVNTQRTAQSIYDNDGTSVSTDKLQAGDLLFFGSSTGKINHVGIYIGDGQYIHASSTNKNVCISSLEGKSSFIAANRIG